MVYFLKLAFVFYIVKSKVILEGALFFRYMDERIVSPLHAGKDGQPEYRTAYRRRLVRSNRQNVHNGPVTDAYDPFLGKGR